MDGHFVPNITIGPPVVKSIQRVAKVPLDVHLMITDPDATSTRSPRRARRCCRSRRSAAAPASHRPRHQGTGRQGRSGSEPVDAGGRARRDRRRRGYVLVMSVNPGFGGQTFIRGASPSSCRTSVARSGRQQRRASKSTAASTPRYAARVVAAGRGSSSPAQRSSTAPIRSVRRASSRRAASGASRGSVAR